MIIKVLGVDGGFTLYGEVDLVTTRPLAQNEVLSDDVIDHTESNYRGIEANPRKNYIRFMNKNQVAETEIIAYSPVYVMNDQGKTVETI